MFITQRVLHGVFWSKRENTVTLSHGAKSKHAFLGEIKEISKTKKLPSRRKIDFELLHQRYGKISTRLLLAGDTADVWEDIELGIYPDLFCTSC